MDDPGYRGYGERLAEIGQEQEAASSASSSSSLAVIEGQESKVSDGASHQALISATASSFITSQSSACSLVSTSISVVSQTEGVSDVADVGEAEQPGESVVVEQQQKEGFTKKLVLL